MTLTPSDQRALWQACEEQWKRHQKRFWRVSLPSQEWEDIKAAAFGRVFRFAERFDPAKGDLSSWTGTVIRRIMMNEFRRSLPRFASHEARTKLQHAQPIVRRLVRNDWGDEQVVVEPDRPVRAATRATLNDVEEFRAMLNQKDCHVVDLLLAGNSVRDIQNRLKLRNWSQAEKTVRGLGDKWRALENERIEALSVAVRSARIRFTGDLADRLQKARNVVKTGLPANKKPKTPRKARQRPSKVIPRQLRPSDSWLQKRFAAGVTVEQWARLKKLYPDLPPCPKWAIRAAYA